jgi:ATPase subunit of ABC transporter with duplicated ATPase domains
MPSISITCSDLSFAWPDGSAVFDGLSFAVGAGRSGLVGRNGTGKSTLLRLIAGELAPTRGSVQVSGRLAYLPQDFALAVDRRVDEVLGIAGTHAALRAIERGDVHEEQFAAVRDDWDVEERARATLDRLGLPHVGLDRRVGQLSGGESVLLGLAARFLSRPDVLLLDEPTNNLDLSSVRQLTTALASYRGAMMVASHDAPLLREAGVTRWLRLERRLTEIDPL